MQAKRGRIVVVEEIQKKKHINYRCMSHFICTLYEISHKETKLLLIWRILPRLCMTFWFLVVCFGSHLKTENNS